jgi:hypothetical protein
MQHLQEIDTRDIHMETKKIIRSKITEKQQIAPKQESTGTKETKIRRKHILTSTVRNNNVYRIKKLIEILNSEQIQQITLKQSINLNKLINACKNNIHIIYKYITKPKTRYIDNVIRISLLHPSHKTLVSFLKEDDGKMINYMIFTKLEELYDYGEMSLGDTIPIYNLIITNTKSKSDTIYNTFRNEIVNATTQILYGIENIIDMDFDEIMEDEIINKTEIKKQMGKKNLNTINFEEVIRDIVNDFTKTYNIILKGDDLDILIKEGLYTTNPLHNQYVFI